MGLRVRGGEESDRERSGALEKSSVTLEEGSRAEGAGDGRFFEGAEEEEEEEEEGWEEEDGSGREECA